MVILPELGDLQRDTDRMKAEVARALTSNDLEEWGKVPMEGIQRMVLGLIRWSRCGGNNVLVAPPAQVVRNSRTLTLYSKVSLTDLLLWVMAGLLTESEIRALNAS